MNTAENLKDIFPKGEKMPDEYFTGNVWMKLLIPNDTILNCQIANVVFERGANNNWHTHPGGQVLIVTSGIGYYQERGKPVRTIISGDVVTVLPGTEHWHGASPDSELTHIAVNPNIQNGVVKWLGRVSDEGYNGET